ncbi:small oligopeptide transporter [Fistulina hepatica ATCC 64428]|uniref:Small oligopeptide transporter n=1 Tax=Fistulina hepatica ATCC 64428 TaxID=1128425 RepID=A0A0D7AEJ2_9AGAR|nr:small oligopeptide transporter [Fistulina hepatica ATCC 64428]
MVAQDESPYPEVRSAVANYDDPDMPVSTIRAWILGLIFAGVVSGLNQLFYFRYPSVQITAGMVTQLISFPMGRALAIIMPHWKIFGQPLNPGPFSVKEHVLVTIMSTVGAGSAYAMDVIAVQRLYYHQVYNFSYQWFLIMSTQLIGFSIGGICRRFLVQPPSMIWPSNLVTCALFNTLHSQQYTGMGERGGISRGRLFCCVFAASALWYYVPGYLFQALSYFSWVTWIKPEDPVIASLFGYVGGLGMSVLTFDWAQIAYVASPLATPWWATANTIIGFVLFYWIVTPIIHFSNVWYGEYMPILSRISYDNRGQAYNLTRILNEQDTIDLDAYHAYSPLFLSTTFAMSYCMCFAAITSTIVHTFIYFRQQLWIQCRRSLHEQPDVHARLMARYPVLPTWWYVCIFSFMFACGVISIELWPTEFPVWGFLLALALAFFCVIPVGMLQAITNWQIGIGVIAELVIGYVLPGKPIAMMMFKTWGYNTMAQALTFSSDFKLGHYMKVRAICCSVFATAIAGTVQLAVQELMFSTIPDLCNSNQSDGFICPGTQVFGTASIVVPLMFFFLIGAVAPFIPYLVGKKYPNSLLKYINPVLFDSNTFIPPATALNYVPFALVSFLFQHVIRKRHFSWWRKYNYVVSAALDSGVAVGILLVYFTWIGENNVLAWWGNTVPFTGADGKGTPVKELAPGQTFGFVAYPRILSVHVH